MQYGPPPLFKQGVPARVKAVIFVLIAVALLFIDSRLQVLGMVRQVISLVIYPAQRAAMVPRDIYDTADEYLTSVEDMREEVKRLRAERLENIQLVQKAQLLESENARLRELLDISRSISIKSVPAEILYDAQNPYINKIVLNRGTKDGVEPGQPVIDEKGVVGQVTAVSLMTSEVTLLTDRDQAIPVLNVRSGERSVAFGKGKLGYLELRFMMLNADVEPGDLLVTSGIDGVYPAGLAVGKIIRLPDNAEGANGHVMCEPVAGINQHQQLLVLLSERKPLPPPPEKPAKGKKGRDTEKKAAGKP